MDSKCSLCILGFCGSKLCNIVPDITHICESLSTLILIVLQLSLTALELHHIVKDLLHNDFILDSHYEMVIYFCLERCFHPLLRKLLIKE
jgi:hypothetical protein